jgi:hypothetical protein
VFCIIRDTILQPPTFVQTNGELALVPPAAVVDPTLFPLPEENDDDFPPPHVRLAKIAKPAVKTAGSRRPSSVDIKGKSKAVTPLAGSSKGIKRGAGTSVDEPEPKKKRGRAAGVVNYSTEDVDGLLDIVEEILPTGGKGWNTVSAEFSAWAEENGRPC